MTVWAFDLQAQDVVRFPIGGSDKMVEARFSRSGVAPRNGKSPAVVLLHSAGGFSNRVTDQYAKALNRAGFVTLEPELFLTPRADARPVDYLPHAYGALAYLASKPEVDSSRIAVSGYSLGGMISLQAALVAVAKAHGEPTLRFAAHAAFYPLCWVFTDMVTGKRKFALPTEAYKDWTGVPIRIYAGGLDDYDGRDPAMCQTFASVLPQSQQALVSVQVYENATHEWDNTAPVSFFREFACKGRGCTNHNVPNPEVTQKSIADLVAFFSKVLRVTQ